MVKKYKILGTVGIGENVLKRGLNFLVTESELNHLSQLTINYADLKGSGFNFYLIMQESITYTL